MRLLHLALLALAMTVPSAKAAARPITLPDLNSIFEQHGLLPIKKELQEDHTFRMHTIYFSPDLKSAVFLRFDVSPVAEAQKSLSLPSGQIRFGKDADGKTYFAYFMGFTGFESSQLSARLDAVILERSLPVGIRGHSSKSARLPRLVPEAHAAEICTPPQDSVLGEQNLQIFNSLQKHSDLEKYKAWAMACSAGAADGFRDATVGTAEALKDMAEFLYQLQHFPGLVAADLKIKWNSIADFFQEFRKNISELGRTFAGLPPEILAQMGCAVLASIGTDVVISIMTAGGGAAKLSATIAAYTKRFLNLEKLLSKLKNLNHLDILSDARFFKSYLDGKISTVRLKAIEFWSSLDNASLARRFAKCGIP